MACVESDLSLYMCMQAGKQGNDSFVKQFRATVDTVAFHGGRPWSHPTLGLAHKAAVLGALWRGGGRGPERQRAQG